MSRFDAVNLSALPAPAALEAIASGAILDARMQYLVARFTAKGVVYNVGALESDPAKILQEADSYRELLVRQRINDAVLATSLAYAVGTDLDVRAADYGVARATGELDDSLRRRAQLAWEALTTAGTAGAYTFHALSVAPAEIADVAVYDYQTPGVAEGEVRIVVLSAVGEGYASTSLLAAIRTKLTARDLYKLNDRVVVIGANICPYTISATLQVKRGPDANAIRDQQFIRALAFATSRRVIGAHVSPLSVAAAVGHDDARLISDMTLTAPMDRIGGGPFDVPVCTGIAINMEVLP